MNKNIVILAAGNGKRFQEAGYNQPKPLIPLPDGRPMIAAVLDNVVYDYNDRVYILNRHPAELRTSPHLKRFSPNYIDLTSVTQGAACTALLAKEFINNDQWLILANSDQYVGDFLFTQAFHHFLNTTDADVVIPSFIDTNPKWSFAKVENGLITEVKEKDPISNIATVGIYAIRKGSDFVKFVERMIHEDVRVNGEFYVCPVFNYFIAEDHRAVPYMVNRMYGLGTPEDFENNKDKIK